MTSDGSFELAGPQDLPRLLPLIQSYYRFDAIPFDRTEVKAALEALLRDPRRGRAWIIVSRRRRARDVGYALVSFGYDLEFGGPLATLTDLYISAAYRRRGLGTKTMQFVERACRELGIGALELQVERRNVAAQAFYRQLGFRPHDRIPMSKRLD